MKNILKKLLKDKKMIESKKICTPIFFVAGFAQLSIGIYMFIHFFHIQQKATLPFWITFQAEIIIILGLLFILSGTFVVSARIILLRMIPLIMGIYLIIIIGNGLIMQILFKSKATIIPIIFYILLGGALGVYLIYESKNCLKEKNHE
jgi:hypothetical protein